MRGTAQRRSDTLSRGKLSRQAASLECDAEVLSERGRYLDLNRPGFPTSRTAIVNPASLEAGGLWPKVKFGPKRRSSRRQTSSAVLLAVGTVAVIGQLVQAGLNESLGLAAGLWAMGHSEEVFDAHGLATSCERLGQSVISHRACWSRPRPHDEPRRPAGKPWPSPWLVVHLHEACSLTVVNGHMSELPARARMASQRAPVTGWLGQTMRRASRSRCAAVRPAPSCRSEQLAESIQAPSW